MNLADGVVLAIVGVSCFFSLWRGFAAEAISLLSWVAAFIIAKLFSVPFTVLLEPYLETPSLRIGVSFVVLFILTLVIGALIARIMSMLIDVTGLSATDRLLGLGFGFARGVLICVVLVFLLRMTPVVQDPWWQQSELIPHLVLMEDWTKQVASDVASLIWNAGR